MVARSLPRLVGMVVPPAERATANTLSNNSSTDCLLGTGNMRIPGVDAGGGSGVDPASHDALRVNGCAHFLPANDQRPGRRRRVLNGGGQQQRKKRKTKGRITVASLNMRGFSTASAADPHEKWMRVNQLMRDQKIAVLALQETHLTASRIASLNSLFAASLIVLGSADVENTTGARGVAFAVNKRIVAEEDLALHEVIPGRAAVLRFRWTGDRVLSLLNVYAPNAPADNELFWTTLLEALHARPGRNPELLTGDFNLVEDSLDRLPGHRDHAGAVESLGRLVGALRMNDGWRVHNPNVRAYSYMQAATGSQSRIDRIYATDELMRKAEDWMIDGVGFATDHRLVSVSLANYKAPYLGKGRWSLPVALLNDGAFATTLRALGTKLQTDIEAIGERTDDRNPQTIYATFKQELRDAARKRAKALLPKLDRKIEALKLDIQALLETDTQDESAVAILQDRLTKLEIRRFDRKRRAVATKDWLQGETMSRYWTKLNAPQLPSTVINELCVGVDDNERKNYSSSSPLMAEAARRHYDGLQADPDLTELDHPAAIAAALEGFTVAISTRQKGELARKLRRCELEEAIRESPLGKAPGLDGIPAELWKTLLRWETAGEVGGRPPLAITKVLRAVFNDIAAHGVIPSSRFTEGWICPIYKLKKDLREVVNYRPITLLNADYKLMTRALAMRLTAVAPTLVPPDQAAFIPGRQIFSHIKLSKVILEYAETAEVNGAIVALDQEKAYDRINHDYLWAVLRRMNFPETFIATVRHLYDRAESCVMLNGVPSDFFRVVRGVRQGDPMSCLLFVLAIEPLAEALRRSNLRGMCIPGDAERLIAALFADDTTVYLDQTDSFTDLESILNKWCVGSRAKFNVDKTEVLPVGTPVFRDELARGVATCALGRTIPRSVRVVCDGHLIRSLGAWIGNNCDLDTPWLTMLRTLEKNLQFWSRRKPTLVGRKLIVDMEIGGRTQFLAKAQTMSGRIEARLERIVAQFMSNGEKKPRIGRDMLYRPVASGGLNLLDIATRNEAMDIVWLRDYLLAAPVRPRWAVVADAIFARATTAASRTVDESAKINAFLQTWDVSTHAVAGLGYDLARLVKAARKYNLRLEPANPSPDLRAQMPVWYHPGEGEGRSLANTLSAKCLRDNHGVTTVADCAQVANRASRSNGRVARHTASRTCRCRDCSVDRAERGCTDPSRCVSMAQKILARLGPLWQPVSDRPRDNLSLTPRRLAANVLARREHTRVLFNPSIVTKGPAVSALRIFGTPCGDPATALPAVRRGTIGTDPRTVEIYTDGSCENNGGDNARAACGVWFGPADNRNFGARLPGALQSNQAAEVYAAELALKRSLDSCPLHIVSDSRFLIEGLTVHLPKWEERGWLGVKCAEFFQRVAAYMRARAAPTSLRWVKGHTGVPGNEGADALASAALTGPTRALSPLPAEVERFVATGMRINALSQRMAYRAIRDTKVLKDRPSSTTMVDRVRATLAVDYDVHVTADAVWKKLRDKDISRKHRDFLWKMAHQAQRVGGYWNYVQGYEARATCAVCHEVDSMEHILMECQAPGQAAIWDMVHSAMLLGEVRVPRATIGAVIGAPLLCVRDGDGRRKKGSTRLLKILTVEAAHLIWRLRCERVIQWEGTPDRVHSLPELRGKLWAAVNRRFLLDCSLARTRAGNRRLKRQLILDTWRPVLVDTADLPEDWLESPGVLVGRLEHAGIG